MFVLQPHFRTYLRRGLIVSFAIYTTLSNAAIAAEPIQRKASVISVYFGSIAHAAEVSDPVIVSELIRSGKVGLYQHAVGESRLFEQNHAAWLRQFETWAPTGLGLQGGGLAIAEEGELEKPIDPAGALYGPFTQFFGSASRLPNITNINVRLSDAIFVPKRNAVRPGTSYSRLGFSIGNTYASGHYSGYLEKTGLAGLRIGVDNMLQVGSKIVCINYTPNFVLPDFDNRFKTAPFWENVRIAYDYAGCAMFDTPASYAMSNRVYTGEPYRRNIAEQIQWNNERGNGTVLLLSPYNSGGDGSPRQAYDQDFLENTIKWISYLKAFNRIKGGPSALPQSWVVLDYDDRPGTIVNGLPGAEGLLRVASWVARNAPVSRPGVRRPTAVSAVSFAEAAMR